MGRIALLDYGYIEAIEHWGSDERIIAEARQSTGKGFLGWGPKGWECHHTGCGWRTDTVEREHQRCPSCGDTLYSRLGDEKLLRYLYENKHSTPFEFAGATIEVQAPIFVFREWHRHRTQSFAEMSARYTPLPDVNYIPTVERLMMRGGANKQASSTGEALTEVNAERFRKQLAKMYAEDEELYQNALSAGVPKELARIHLPVGRFSRMGAIANLRNWLGFLTLRQAPGAQYEIRVYADALHDILAERFPRTLALFDEGTKT
jgi:thymidylate synthase (FAD)